MNEVEEKINSEIQKSDSSKSFLLSEIQVNLPEGDPQVVVKKIMDNIKMEGFEITAKKFSLAKSAENGGSIGWVKGNELSKNIYNNIKNLETNETGEPIFLENVIIIVKKMGEKVYEKNLEKVKDNIIRIEKQKKLKMFSNSHYSNLERITQINFL